MYSKKVNWIGRQLLQKMQQFKPKANVLSPGILNTSIWTLLFPEEKAAHLLYFLVKNHSFVDGNKRIAAAVFLRFAEKNKLIYDKNGDKRIADNALVAMTLMIAESKPTEKAVITAMLTNLIAGR